MVTLGGDKLQLIVDVHSRGVDDLVTGGFQDGVGDFPFGHRLPCHRQRKGGVYLPVGLGVVGALQEALGRKDTALHIVAGLFKHLFAGHIADGFAVDLYFQHKLQA